MEGKFAFSPQTDLTRALLPWGVSKLALMNTCSKDTNFNILIVETYLHIQSDFILLNQLKSEIVSSLKPIASLNPVPRHLDPGSGSLG